MVRVEVLQRRIDKAEEYLNFLKDIKDKYTIEEFKEWDDIMYKFYVKKKIDIGLEAVEKGNILSHDDVKKRFLG